MLERRYNSLKGTSLTGRKADKFLSETYLVFSVSRHEGDSGVGLPESVNYVPLHLSAVSPICTQRSNETSN